MSLTRPRLNILFPAEVALLGCEHVGMDAFDEGSWDQDGVFSSRWGRVHEGLCAWCPQPLQHGVATTVQGLVEVGLCSCCQMAFSVVSADLPDS